MGVSLPALLLGVCLLILVCFIVSYAELVISYIQIGFLQFPPVVIGLFFFIVIINRLMPRLNQRLKLSSRELMLIYCMMLIASLISSRGLMEKLIPALVAVNYFANESNNWADLFFPFVKDWLVPFDPNRKSEQKTVIDFYEGTIDAIPWGEWVSPLLAWGVVVFLVFFAFLCLATIIRKQWVENEKLSFPLVQLPLEFANPERRFFRNRLMWLGFTLPTLVFSLNGLHSIFPQVPSLQLRYVLNDYLNERPFNGIFYTPIFLSLAGIGFFYLLPTQLLFSLWFFFLLTRMQDVVAALFGFRVSNMPLYPTRLHIGYQMAGAYIVLVIYFVYTGFPHLKEVFRAAFRWHRNASSEVKGEDELLPYSTAVWGLILSLLGVVLWMTFAGVNPTFALLQVVVYIGVVAIVMARSTAEAGMLMTETSFRPIDIYQIFAAKKTLGPSSLTTLSFFDAIFTRDQRGLILTTFLDSLKISQSIKLNRRLLLVVILLSIVLASICAALIHLWLPYRQGGNYMYSYVYRANPIWAFQDNASSLEGLQTTSSLTALIFFIVGINVATGLIVMRSLYWWWPLYPLGYALSASWSLIVFWFPILVAWLIKTPILKYGGLGRYIWLRPFFLGLIFGEFSMAVVWTAVSWIWEVPAPFFPWP